MIISRQISERISSPFPLSLPKMLSGQVEVWKSDLDRCVIELLDLDTLVQCRLVSWHAKTLADSVFRVRRKCPHTELSLSQAQMSFVHHIETKYVREVRYTHHRFGMRTALISMLLARQARIKGPIVLIVHWSDLRKYTTQLTSLGLFLSKDPENSPVIRINSKFNPHIAYISSYVDKHRYIPSKFFLLSDVIPSQFLALAAHIMSSAEFAVMDGWMSVSGITPDLTITRSSSVASKPYNLVIAKSGCLQLCPIPIWCENTPYSTILSSHRTVFILANMSDAEYGTICGPTPRSDSGQRVSKRVVSPFRIGLASGNTHFIDYLVRWIRNPSDGKTLPTDALLLIDTGKEEHISWTVQLALLAINHRDTTRNWYNLYIICPPERQTFWDYIKVCSYRPWMQTARGNWYDPNPSAADIAAKMARCALTTSSPDRCIVCSDVRYFRHNYDARAELERWWNTYRDPRTTWTFDTLLDLAESIV